MDSFFGKLVHQEGSYMPRNGFVTDVTSQVTQLVTSHLLHSLYNIILRLASFSRSVFTHINSATSNNKNNTNFYTKTRYKTPWIIFLHLQMVFWVEISSEKLKFHR